MSRGNGRTESIFPSLAKGPLANAKAAGSNPPKPTMKYKVRVYLDFRV